MAKALLGYVGGSDPRLLAEMRRLQQRVQDLESELGRIQAENDALTAAASHDSLMELDARQARVVECRFFGGMTEDETAEALGIGLRTAKRDWSKAKSWRSRCRIAIRKAPRVPTASWPRFEAASR